MTEWTLRVPTQAEGVDLALALLFKIWAVLCLGLFVGAATGPHGLPMVPMALMIFGLAVADILSCLGRCLTPVLSGIPHDQTPSSRAVPANSPHQTGLSDAAEDRVA